jgi:hypothetical protein
MKKFSLGSLACAVALAVSPAVLVGQTLDFTGGGVTVTGTFTLVSSPIGTIPLDYNFATFNGTVSGSNLGSSVVVTLDPVGTSTAPGGDVSSPGGGVNNQFYPDQNGTAGGITGAAYLDGWGLLLMDANGDEINIFGNGGGSYYFYDDVYIGPGNYTLYQGTVSSGSLTVPESGSAGMLMLCGFCLAGVFSLRGQVVRVEKC